MKKLLFLVGLFWSVASSAQFVPGQLLTAAELNSAFANTAPAPGITCLGASSALNYTSNTFSCNAAINAVTLGGATFSAPGPIGSVSTSSGAFSSVSTPSATIGGGSINATTVGATSPSTGAFTTLSASSTVSGAGFTTLLSPYLLSATASSTYAPIASPTFTGIPAAPTAAATTNTTQLATTAMVNSAITGNNLAGSFTTLAASSTINPSQIAGIVGTTTNNNANAGSVGEFPTPANLTGVSLSTGVAANVSSISLTAGDWEVSGSIQFVPAATTTVQVITGGVTSSSATLPTSAALTLIQSTLATGALEIIPVPVQRFSLASTTTVYIVAQATFGVSTMTAGGFLHVRRVR